MTATNPTVPELRGRIEESWESLQALLARLDERQLTAADGEEWSVKDQLAHLAAWERSLAALLEGRPRDRALDLCDSEGEAESDDIDALNAAIRERAAGRTLAQILAESRDAHQQVLRALDALSNEDLLRPYGYFQPQVAQDDDDDDRPVVGWIIGNTFEHYDEHRASIEQQVGTVQA